jgi:proline iminopeptidase
MSRRDLFPPIEPYATGTLAVDPRHTLYWEESGNPNGVPVIFLHGGPGAGATATHRRFFDPMRYRILVFDQRGAGRSMPLGELADNSLHHLVGDLERLRQHFAVERWHVFGGSWGSTLALAYAQSHPDRCRSLVLRGIFLCRAAEVDWFLYGMRRIFPEAWRNFAAAIPAQEQRDLLAAYYRRLTHPDPLVHAPAARAWSAYEGACSTLLPSSEGAAGVGQDRMALGLARIEAHYFKTEIIPPEKDLLTHIGRIRDIPTIIVQGRYDMICPIAAADELARAWPEAEYVVVPDAGHSAMEPGVRAHLVAATEQMKRLP